MDLFACRIRVFVEKYFGGNHHAGCAVTALYGPRLAERVDVDLLLSLRKTLHRRDGTTVKSRDFLDTCLDKLAIHNDGTRPTRALAATVLDRHQEEIVSQKINQPLVLIDCMCLVVNR